MKKLNQIIALKFLTLLSLLLSQGTAESKQPASDIYLINLPTQFTPPCSIEGEASGLHQQYYDSGALYSATNCLEGKKEGIEQKYYENGQLWMKSFYVRNKLEGEFIFYYPEGTIHKEFFYRLGQKHGVQKTYDKQGGLYREEAYVAGLRNGSSKEFNRDGNVLAEKIYKNEKMISSQSFPDSIDERNQVARPMLDDLMKAKSEKGLFKAGQNQNIQKKRPNRDVFNNPEKIMDKDDSVVEYWGS